MTDMSGLRLWPLALMGWLAAYPPAPKDASGETPPGLEEAEADRTRTGQAAPAARPGSRTAWLGMSRARYAHLTDEERARLRAERRAARQAQA